MTLRATGPGAVRIVPDGNPASLHTFLENFDHDGDRPKPEHTKWLRDNVFPRLATGQHLWISGRASKVGNAAYNQDLSRRRAQAVKAFLLTEGRAAEAQIDSTRWSGSSLATGNDAQDRSVELQIQPATPGPIAPAPPAVTPTATAVSTIKVWINSFIPRTVPGVTHTVTVGPHAGKTFVFGPPIPTPTFPPTLKRGAFLTSNRTFSTSDTRAPVHFKMHTDMAFDFTKSPPVLTTKHVGGESIEVDPVTGAVLRTAFGSTLRMFARPILPPLLGVPLPAVKVPIKMSCSIPLVFGSGTIADMDVIGFLTVDPIARKVVYSGKVDEFPAYEAYVSVNGGPPLILFQQDVLPGKTPNDLIGLPTLIPLPGTVTF